MKACYGRTGVDYITSERPNVGPPAVGAEIAHNPGQWFEAKSDSRVSRGSIAKVG